MSHCAREPRVGPRLLTVLSVTTCIVASTACGGVTNIADDSTTPATTTLVLPTPPEEGRLGTWSCAFTTPDVPPVHIENPTAAATGMYEQGLIAARDGRAEDARSAFADALVEDPTFSLAAYSLGVVLLSLGRDDEATLALERVVAGDPSSIDALYRLGVLHLAHEEFEQARGYLQRAVSLAPRELELAKKLVQALHGLGLFEQAAHARREVRRIRACSDDPDIGALRAFVIDQFTLGEERVLVYEVFDPDPEWTVYYAFQVVRGDQAVRAVQLESDSLSRARGVAAGLGIDFPDDRHFTTDRTFPTLPSYEVLRPLAIELIRESAAREP